MNDAEKQAAYEQRRSKSRPAAMASYTTTEYRVYRPGVPVFCERAIGPSQIVAYYPDFLRIEIVGSEPVCAECPAAGGFY